MTKSNPILDGLEYDPSTGVFTWVAHSNRRDLVGFQAGSVNSDGYIHIKFRGRLEKAHRLAYLFMGYETPEFVDHANGVRADNRWANLRPATPAENCRNSKRYKSNGLGLKGVSYHKASGRFAARIQVGGRRIQIGLFDTPEEAFKAYCSESHRHHGTFANTGET